MPGRIINRLKDRGLRAFIGAVWHFAFPVRLPCLQQCKTLLQDGKGLEIGGPSQIFSRRGCMPVYTHARHIDNCNFDHQTLWEGRIQTGDTFRFSRSQPPGRQFVAEASDLAQIADASYDFVLSSHCIEHLANPLLGLQAWLRVLKAGGTLLLVVPHKEGTFDHRRPVTSLQHLLDDLQAGTGEDDLTHLDEILALHDLQRDPEAGDIQQFRARSQQNLQNRGLHHHVFDTRLAVQMLDHMGLQLQAVEAVQPYHIVLLARKPRDGETLDNRAFLAADAVFLRESPFNTDHPQQATR